MKTFVKIALCAVCFLALISEPTEGGVFDTLAACIILKLTASAILFVLALSFNNKQN